jgi:hypothetical protein
VSLVLVDCRVAKNKQHKFARRVTARYVMKRRIVSMPRDVPANGKQLLLSIKDRVPWALKFHEVLIEFPSASDAFERLIAAGCEPVDLLHWLDVGCSDYATQTREKREIGEEIALFGGQLLKKARDLQKIEASRKKKEILKTVQLPEFQGLSVRLQAYAECLINEATELKQGRSVREAPGLLTGWLAAYVAGSTDDNHYREIARLMEAHYSMRGIHQDISSRAVEKKAKRFRQKHAFAYSHIKNMTSRQLGRYKEKTFLEKYPWLFKPKQAEK